MDSSFAREKLGWCPTWSQEEAITSTLNWWQKAIVKNVDPNELCLEDMKNDY